MFHPSDLLPEELWRHHVFDKLPPEALISLSDAHPFWFQLLESRRPAILMELCLPIITSLKHPSARGLWFGQSIPVLELPHADLLNIRLVCKSWNRAITQNFQKYVYEDRPFINEKDPQLADFFSDFNGWNTYRRVAEERPEVLIVETGDNSYHGRHKKTPRVVAAWLDSLEPTKFPSANPILSREAIFNIVDSTPESEQEAVDVVTRSLRAYGERLLRCTFVLNLQGPDPLERQYSLLESWLQLVPNLVILEVDFFQELYFPGMVELENLIQKNPLPDLPQLSKLTIKRLPPPLGIALLKKYNKVQTLELEMVRCLGASFPPVQMENLITLAVDVPNTAELTNLQQLLTDSWMVHLEKLEMYAVSFNNHDPILDYEWRDVFAFLNANFSNAENLVKVHLHLPYYHYTIPLEKRLKILMDTQTCRLRLPRVEELKLLAGHLFQMDFLLPMRHSLKKMSILNFHGHPRIDYPTNTSVELRQNIQWNGWLAAGLLKSNFWEAFPNLEFLRVQKEKAGWTYRRRNGNKPVLICQNGNEERLQEEPVVDWDEKAGEDGDGVAAH